MKFSFYLLKMTLSHGDGDGSGGSLTREEAAGQSKDAFGEGDLRSFSYFLETSQSKEGPWDLKGHLFTNGCFRAAASSL